MRIFSWFALCLIFAGCTKGSSNQGTSAQPLKKDPAIQAALYALQTIDYVETYVEKPSVLHPTIDLDSYITAAVEKIPDEKLQAELNALHMSQLELDREHIGSSFSKEIFEKDTEYFHHARDHIMDEIKAEAAARNASVELWPMDMLEIAHPQEKWGVLGDVKRGVVYYEISARNAVITEDPFNQKDKEARVKLNVVCGEGLKIAIEEIVETGKVRLKFDDAAPVNETWAKGEYAIFSPHPRQLFTRFSKTKTFSVELTPQHRKPQTVVFGLGDFKETVGKSEYCAR